MEQKENSKLYRLEEMSDAMAQSIENAHKVAREQEALLDVVKSCDKAKDFEGFIKEMDESTINTYNQIEKLIGRKDKLDAAIEICSENKKCEEVMNLLLAAFGIFEE